MFRLWIRRGKKIEKEEYTTKATQDIFLVKKKSSDA